MKKIRPIIQWALVLICFLAAIGWMPTLTSALLMLAAVVMLPIKPVEEFCEKIRLKFAVRVVIALILFIVAFSVSPDKPPATVEKEAREKNASSSDNNDNKDEKKDSRDQIIGTWTYDGSHAITFCFTFNEDGTWKMDSDGGSYDNGTYEIVDGNKIEMKGNFKDYNFTIKKADKLLDENGETLIPYVPDNEDD